MISKHIGPGNGNVNGIPCVPGRISSTRRSLGMSVLELVERSQYSSTNSIRNIESGRRNPSLSGLMSLAEALNVSVEYLTGEDSANKVTVRVPKVIPNPEVPRNLPDMKVFRRRLTSAREELGYTSLDLAQMTCLSESTVRSVENGDSGTSIRGLVSLAIALGVTTDYLLGLDRIQPRKPNRQANGKVEKDFGTLQLVELLNELSSRCQEVASSMT